MILTKKALSKTIKRLANNQHYQAGVDAFLSQTNNTYTLANYVSKVGSTSLTSMAENGHLSDRTMGKMMESASYLRTYGTLDAVPKSMQKTVENLTSKIIKSLDKKPVIEQSDTASAVPQPPKISVGEDDSSTPTINPNDRRLGVLQTALTFQPQAQDVTWKRPKLLDWPNSPQKQTAAPNSFKKGLQSAMVSQLRSTSTVGLALSRHLLSQKPSLGESFALEIMKGNSQKNGLVHWIIQLQPIFNWRAWRIVGNPKRWQMQLKQTRTKAAYWLQR